MLPGQIADGARTVVHLHGHIETLKQRAWKLIRQFEASRRGYFTPTEDEQTRQLLVSYRNSRNALLDLVTSFRDAPDVCDSQRSAVVLVAFAGALVLVDVARFLREQFHHRPVVRAKLNEPEPHYGVPAGTYDLVQKSLTSPVHAWHLYHAAVFFDRNRDTFEVLAESNSDMRHLLHIVIRLQSRLDVSLDRFLLARTRSRVRELRSRVGRDLLGKALYGLQKCVSRMISDRYVHVGHDPVLPVPVQRQVESLLMPGDVLVVRKDYALTNYFLPGYWPHAAMYVGCPADLQAMRLHDHETVRPWWHQLESIDPQRPARVLESMKDGVQVRSLSNPFRSDAVAVIRPRLTTSQVAEAIGRAFFHTGKPYDFDFDFSRSDRLVCTEVIYRGFDGVGGLRFRLSRRAGRLNLSAEDLLQMAIRDEGFSPVAVFCRSVADRVLVDERARDALVQTVGQP